MKAIFSEISEDKKKKVFLLDTEHSKEICKVKNVNGVDVEIMYISQKGRLFTQDMFTKELKYSKKEHKKNKELLARLHADVYQELYGTVEEG